jgi:outer membrane biogenesis lipoprotein LolB
MKPAKFAILPLVLAMLAACESEAEKQADATEDRIVRWSRISGQGAKLIPT